MDLKVSILIIISGAILAGVVSQAELECAVRYLIPLAYVIGGFHVLFYTSN